MRAADEEEGPTGSPTPVYSLVADGTVGHGCCRTIPCHVVREPVLSDGGMLLHEMAGVYKKATRRQPWWLEHWCTKEWRYGAFRDLHSEQGTNFGSKVVAEVCQLFGEEVWPGAKGDRMLPPIVARGPMSQYTRTSPEDVDGWRHTWGAPRLYGEVTCSTSSVR